MGLETDHIAIALLTVQNTTNQPPVYQSSHSLIIMGPFNPLMGTSQQQTNEPLYSNMVIGTLAVDEWALTVGTARRGLGGLQPNPVPSSLYQM